MTGGLQFTLKSSVSTSKLVFAILLVMERTDSVLSSSLKNKKKSWLFFSLGKKPHSIRMYQSKPSLNIVNHDGKLTLNTLGSGRCQNWLMQREDSGERREKGRAKKKKTCLNICRADLHRLCMRTVYKAVEEFSPGPLQMNKSLPLDKLITVAQLLPCSDGWRQRRPTPSQRPIHLASFLSAVDLKPPSNWHSNTLLSLHFLIGTSSSFSQRSFGTRSRQPGISSPNVYLCDAGISVSASPALRVTGCWGGGRVTPGASGRFFMDGHNCLCTL